ncbi:MAG TPA: 4-hydroxy-tetrahydrodipicolinate synthase [Thermodesulfobacteriota bacterium]|nr:4-hydroxy-tetrahydrodipicolinate synthase [Thermodesulfobacteriota bacterium]
MKEIDFSGCHIPLVTPFKEDFSLDEDGLRRLVNYLIEEEKVDGLVPCGTTGESPTLDHEEHHRVIEITVKEARGRVPVIAGTGSNSTQEAIAMTRHAEEAGADATLQVGPYYNKPTMDGMIAHFEAIAKSTKLPVLIYNIPGRTGKNIDPQTMIRLAEIDNIVGLKDACGDITQTMDIINGTKRKGKTFYVLSGEDSLTYPLMALGGDGVICAVGNVIGREYTTMVKLMREGKYAEAREIHYKTLPLVKTLFIETNPVPVKEAMVMMGLPSGPVRLPLVAMRPANREKLRQDLVAVGRLKG